MSTRVDIAQGGESRIDTRLLRAGKLTSRLVSSGRAMYAQTHIDVGLLRAGKSTNVGTLLRAGTKPVSIRVCSPAVLTQVKFAQG